VEAESAAPLLSSRLLQQFVAAATEEVGAEKLALVLADAGLAAAELEAGSLARLDGRAAAGLCARLQQALRAYYGRGARGLLLRIGRGLWQKMTAQANFREKAELQIARRLPVPARRRRVLEFIAARLREAGGAASVHLLDVDLLLVDRSGASACGQAGGAPLCHVTLGMIQGALAWAVGREADVEETACKATGAAACEFKVSFYQ
jgi:predicted hydrocarbon binding protein